MAVPIRPTVNSDVVTSNVTVAFTFKPEEGHYAYSFIASTVD
jgi:hypothetical protein